MLCRASAAAPPLQGSKWFLLFPFPVRWSHPLSWLVSWPLTLAHNFGWKFDKHLGLQLNGLLRSTAGDLGRKKSQWQRKKELCRSVLFTMTVTGAASTNSTLSSHQSGKKGSEKSKSSNYLPGRVFWALVPCRVFSEGQLEPFGAITREVRGYVETWQVHFSTAIRA